MTAHATEIDSEVFENVPRDARGHFVLHLYAAVYRVVQHVAAIDDADPDSGLLEEFAFLGGYFAEMRGLMPDELSWDEGAAWWEQQVSNWELQNREHALPIAALASTGEWTFVSRLAFVLVGLVEEDSRFGTLFARLQEPLASRRPTFELAGRLAGGPGTDPWEVCRPLIRDGVVQAANAEAPRSEWVLHAAPVLWECLRASVELRLLSGAEHCTAARLVPIDELLVADSFRDTLRRLPNVLESGRSKLLIVRGGPGADARLVAEAVARASGLGVLRIEAGASLDTLRRLRPGLHRAACDAGVGGRFGAGRDPTGADLRRLPRPRCAAARQRGRDRCR